MNNTDIATTTKQEELGEWREKKAGGWYCSSCKKAPLLGGNGIRHWAVLSQYCPHCGKLMKNSNT